MFLQSLLLGSPVPQQVLVPLCHPAPSHFGAASPPPHRCPARHPTAHRVHTDVRPGVSEYRRPISRREQAGQPNPAEGRVNGSGTRPTRCVGRRSPPATMHCERTASSTDRQCSSDQFTLHHEPLQFSSEYGIRRQSRRRLGARRWRATDRPHSDRQVTLIDHAHRRPIDLALGAGTGAAEHGSGAPHCPASHGNRSSPVSATAGLMALHNDDRRGSVRGMRDRWRAEWSPSAKSELPKVDAMTTPIAEYGRARDVTKGRPQVMRIGSSVLAEAPCATCVLTIASVGGRHFPDAGAAVEPRVCGRAQIRTSSRRPFASGSASRGPA